MRIPLKNNWIDIKHIVKVSKKEEHNVSIKETYIQCLVEDQEKTNRDLIFIKKMAEILYTAVEIFEV